MTPLGTAVAFEVAVVPAAGTAGRTLGFGGATGRSVLLFA